MHVLKRTKRLLGLTALAVLVLLSGYGALFAYILNQTSHIAEVESGIALEVQREERLRALKNLLQDTKAQRAALDRYFITPDGVARFIEEVEALAGVTGAALEVQSVSVESAARGEDEAETYERLRLNVNALGSWQEIYHTLALIEALPYQTALRQVRLEYAPGGEGEAGHWNGRFNFSVAKLK